MKNILIFTFCLTFIILTIISGNKAYSYSYSYGDEGLNIILDIMGVAGNLEDSINHNEQENNNKENHEHNELKIGDNLKLRSIEITYKKYLFRNSYFFVNTVTAGKSIDIEQAYVNLPIAGATLEIGKDFLMLSRLNQQHPHQWWFITPPITFRAIIGEEGAKGINSKLSYTFPISQNFLLNTSFQKIWDNSWEKTKKNKPFISSLGLITEISNGTLQVNYYKMFNPSFSWSVSAKYVKLLDFQENKQITLEGEFYKLADNNQGWWAGISKQLNRSWQIGTLIGNCSIIDTNLDKNNLNEYSLVIERRWGEFRKLKFQFIYNSNRKLALLVGYTQMFLLGGHPSHEF